MGEESDFSATETEGSAGDGARAVGNAVGDFIDGAVDKVQDGANAVVDTIHDGAEGVSNATTRNETNTLGEGGDLGENIDSTGGCEM